jgi:hypothetical protein
MELICSFLVRQRILPSGIDEISHLRLTCREFKEKTQSIFAKFAFKRLSIHPRGKSLQRLSKISQLPLFAAQVKLIMFHDYERVFLDNGDFLKAHDAAHDPDISNRERQNAKKHLRRGLIEQDHKDFIDRWVP